MFLHDDKTALDGPADVLDEALETVKQHLSMDVAYVSKITANHVTFQHVAGFTDKSYVRPGRTIQATHMFCKHIVAGDVPCVVEDTAANAALSHVPFIQDANVGAFVTVPIRLTNGDLYGMFCCYSYKPRFDISQRDLDTVSMFAKLTTRTLNQHFNAQHEIETLKKRLAGVITDDAFSIHLQPIVALSCNPL
jgi:transcriptional regulator with GAF, ATPase, and Fis domain